MRPRLIAVDDDPQARIGNLDQHASMRPRLIAVDDSRRCAQGTESTSASMRPRLIAVDDAAMGEQVLNAMQLQ